MLTAKGMLTAKRIGLKGPRKQRTMNNDAVNHEPGSAEEALKEVCKLVRNLLGSDTAAQVIYRRLMLKGIMPNAGTRAAMLPAVNWDVTDATWNTAIAVQRQHNPEFVVDNCWTPPDWDFMNEIIGDEDAQEKKNMKHNERIGKVVDMISRDFPGRDIAEKHDKKGYMVGLVCVAVDNWCRLNQEKFTFYRWNDVNVTFYGDYFDDPVAMDI